MIAEEAERGLDAESAAAKELAFLEATRAGRSDVGSRPVGADPVAIAEARLQAARDRLAEEVAAKRERIAVVREQIRQFEAGQGPKPHLGPFSFDENRGQQVARAKRWGPGPNGNWPPPEHARPHLPLRTCRLICHPCREGAGMGRAASPPGASARSPGAM
ncbi:hypothetical protein ABT158_51100 [Nonomuraea sp. NPDC001636]|uniref:hypothetical protein n=1 Tax=Nonomuraea sp. NPDC001636 TaxID=3154391 RepID=UPI00332E3802